MLSNVKAGLYFLIVTVVIKFDTLNLKSREEEERDRMKNQVIIATSKKRAGRGYVHGHRDLECEPDGQALTPWETLQAPKLHVPFERQ